MPIAASISLGDIALDAARYMDNGNFKMVEALRDQCLELGFTEEEIEKAFDAEGASLRLIPQGQQRHGCSMLRATKA